MTDVDDGYASYYSQRLWALLPEIYRTEDTDSSGAPGPLRELLTRVAAQTAVVRRSLDRLWADQSIETCDDWVIPYIGDLLGTNLINGLDPRGQRIDVGKTIYYRRRKGTLSVLEELARDVTGWEVRVVEGFRRLARTRHALDPMVGGAVFPGAVAEDLRQLLITEDLIGALTGTPAGGFADLRNSHGAALSGSAFDEAFHTADLRAGRGSVGHFGIPKLLVFLWRLTSFRIDAGTPVAVAGCPGQFVFDPTGREIPLFLPPTPSDDSGTWAAAHEWQVPGPLTTGLLQATTEQSYPDPPPASFAYQAIGAVLDRVWPELGRFEVQLASPLPSDIPLTVGYHYGFAADVGAGPYDRLRLGDPPPHGPAPVAAVRGGRSADPHLADALAALAPIGTVTIDDSLTYDTLADIGTTAVPIQSVQVAAAPQQRPVLRPALASPIDSTPPAWVFTGGREAQLTLDGLLLSGCDIVLRGSFDTVRITACTFDPGTLYRGAMMSPLPATPLATAVDGQPLRPTTLWIEDNPAVGSPLESGPGAIRELRIDHSILGPIRTRFGGSVEVLKITDSIVQAIPATIGAEYTVEDVFDPTLLTAEMLADDPLSGLVLAALPTATQTALHAYTAPNPVPQVVIDGLNQVVTGASLWDPVVFGDLALAPNLLALTGIPPSPPSAATASLNRGLLDAAFPVALGLAAIAVSDAQVCLSRVSVLGAVAAHRLMASDSILTGFTNVDNNQDGCIRFTAYVGGSRVPRRYESVTVDQHASLFTSIDYGNPGYAKLLEAADQAITGDAAGATISAGADNGSEMGAFSSGLAPIRERGLLTKYTEYMPLGLTPVIIHVT